MLVFTHSLVDGVGPIREKIWKKPQNASACWPELAGVIRPKSFRA